MTTTHVREHTQIAFANPYLVCGKCRERITGYHDPARCGCTADWYLVPCQHEVHLVSTCPSWGPVDGCRCKKQFGTVTHEEQS